MEILGCSIGIGIYQGCFRSKQLTTNEFLIADGRMRVIRLEIIDNDKLFLIDFTNCNEFISKSYVCSNFTWNSN